jgi:hypothetical protein
MRALIAAGVLALMALSALWTTIKSRRLLRQSLGREIKPGEEMSLRSWMQVSDRDLESANKALDQDPLNRLLKVVDRKLDH